jgi:hypothetical protein
VKNVQIIDSADNCTYSVYQVTDEQFAIIFPRGGDIEFIEDVEQRLGEDEFLRFHSGLWGRPIEKLNVVGIHGTLFYGLADKKRRFYPAKRFYDDIQGFAANQRRSFKIQ